MSDKTNTVMTIDADNDRETDAVKTTEAKKTSRALTLVESSRLDILQTPAKNLRESALVIAFAITTRMKNAIERRVKQLRAEIDTLFDENLGSRALRPGMEEVQVRAKGLNDEGPGSGESFFVVKAVNSRAHERIVDEEKARALCTRLKIDFDANFMVQEPRPPQPEAVFSEEKFKAAVTLEMLSAGDLESCLVSAPVKKTVTVDVPEEVDVAIRMVMLGSPSKDLLVRVQNEIAVATGGVAIVQPVGNCDGSKKYAYSESTRSNRGKKLAVPCPGCRACS